MISLLSKFFIKDNKNYEDATVREKYGLLCGFVGIFINIVLFTFKFLTGRLVNSIAITADAFNNLSDAGASVVSLVGIKLANKKPDPDHPFGHGRMEYMTSLVVAMAILLTGYELLKSSIDSIRNPEPVTISAATIIVLIAAICGKLYMYLYNRKTGKRINSAVLMATAADSISDCLATLAVLIATIVGGKTGLLIDGYCGLLVTIFVLRAGYETAKETIASLLGQPPEKEFVDEINDIVMSHKIVKGIHDLVVHDYGPGRVMITLHAEVPSTMNIMEIHDEIDNIEFELRKKLKCEATIHMDPIDSENENVVNSRKLVSDIAKEIDSSFSVHDFRMVPGKTHTNLIFDVVIPFAYKKSDEEVKNLIQDKVKEYNQNYFCVINVDKSYVK